ncbi:MAG: response regulator [Gemmatimonadales bacterium]|nr:response regulator [Gemmatimonadales bacterium]
MVYVVDDEPSVGRALARLLWSGGYEGRIFTSAEEFLMNSGDEGPACLLLDAKMPGMGGEALLGYVRERGLPYGVVFVTAHASEELSRRVRAGGAVACLAKPPMVQELLAAVEAALADARSRAA